MFERQFTHVHKCTSITTQNKHILSCEIILKAMRLNESLLSHNDVVVTAVMMAAAVLSVRSGDRYSRYSADNQEEEETFGNPAAGTQTLIIQIFHKPYFQISKIYFKKLSSDLF